MTVATLENDLDRLNYWVDALDEDIKCFSDKERVRVFFIKALIAGLIHYYELPEQKGVVVYFISDDYLGNLCLSEVLMYIKRPYRGDVKLFKKLVEHIESEAKAKGCKTVRIGSNTGYNDQGILKVLERWGYKQDAVVKEIL